MWISRHKLTRLNPGAGSGFALPAASYFQDMEVSIMVNDKIEAAASEKQRHVEESLRSIREEQMKQRFGTITLTVHEEQVVQSDVTENNRLRPTGTEIIVNKHF